LALLHQAPNQSGFFVAPTFGLDVSDVASHARRAKKLFILATLHKNQLR
jgi:hypothetical protein